jgi:hypothetical protein
MRLYGFILVVGILVSAEQAHACGMFVQRELSDVRFADVVVVGRITDYRIIRDKKFREDMLKNP